MEINYDILRAIQALIDTLEELIKCLKKDQNFKTVEGISSCAISKQIKVCGVSCVLVAYVFGELFTSTELPCMKENPEYEKQWDIEFDYIFYYFCYRASSPKSIEAFLSTTLLHPIWEVKEGVYFEEQHI